MPTHDGNSRSYDVRRRLRSPLSGTRMSEAHFRIPCNGGRCKAALKELSCGYPRQRMRRCTGPRPDGRRFAPRRAVNVAYLLVLMAAVVVMACQSTAYAQGACCLPDGSCQDMGTPSECEALGGWYPGVGRPCAVTTCAQSQPGACCSASLPDGCAEYESEAVCLANTGAVWQGIGTSCTEPGICDPSSPLGACCSSAFENGCADGVLEQDCYDVNGTWAGSETTCRDEGVCGPAGVCCGVSDEWCMDDVFETHCQELGGTWRGSEVSCSDPGVCGVQSGTGACCGTAFEGGCADGLTQQECTAFPGAFWVAEGTLCSDPGICGEPGPFGACCGPSVPGGCVEDQTQDACGVYDGAFWVGPGTTCADIQDCATTEQHGACCDASTSQCTQTTDSECSGSFFSGSNCLGDTDGNGVDEACEIPGDVDGDADVDGEDVYIFVVCIDGSGPAVRAEPECRRADLDNDGRVDLRDCAVLQRSTLSFGF